MYWINSFEHTNSINIQLFDHLFVRNKKGMRIVDVTTMEKESAKQYRKVYDVSAKGKLTAGYSIRAHNRTGIIQYVDVKLRQMLVSFEQSEMVGIVYFEDISLFSR